MEGWRALLDRHQIMYVDRGANVGRGHIAIKCPYCADDPSHHLTINEQTGGWRCWRDPEQHRGWGARRLLRKLLGYAPDIEDFNLGRAEPKTHNPPQPVTMPLGVKRLSDLPSDSIFHQYLYQRGFDEQAIDVYPIHAAYQGYFKDRIVFPVYYYGSIVSWVGRTIVEALPRYLTLAGCSIDALFNIVQKPRQNLLVTEGPFDALNVDYYSIYFNAVALLGLKLTSSRLRQLIDLSARYQKVGICLDSGCDLLAAQMCLKIPNAFLVELPGGIKDPGEMSCDQIRRWETEVLF